MKHLTPFPFIDRRVDSSQGGPREGDKQAVSLVVHPWARDGPEGPSRAAL